MFLRDTYRLKLLLGPVQHSSDMFVAALRTVICSMWSVTMVGVSIWADSFCWGQNRGLLFSRGVTAGTGCLFVQHASQGEARGNG